MAGNPFGKIFKKNTNIAFMCGFVASRTTVKLQPASLARAYFQLVGVAIVTCCLFFFFVIILKIFLKMLVYVNISCIFTSELKQTLKNRKHDNSRNSIKRNGRNSKKLVI